MISAAKFLLIFPFRLMKHYSRLAELPVLCILNLKVQETILAYVFHYGNRVHVIVTKGFDLLTL